MARHAGRELGGNGPEMDETMGAVTAAADVNDDVSMVSLPTPEELATARELVRAAMARGVSFAATADGVLTAQPKTVVETALEEELSDHLGVTQQDDVSAVARFVWFQIGVAYWRRVSIVNGVYAR